MRATCMHCRCGFDAKRSTAVFCSTRCRVAAHRAMPGVAYTELVETARRLRNQRGGWTKNRQALRGLRMIARRACFDLPDRNADLIAWIRAL